MKFLHFGYRCPSSSSPPSLLDSLIKYLFINPLAWLRRRDAIEPHLPLPYLRALARSFGDKPTHCAVVRLSCEGHECLSCVVGAASAHHDLRLHFPPSFLRLVLHHLIFSRSVSPALSTRLSRSHFTSAHTRARALSPLRLRFPSGSWTRLGSQTIPRTYKRGQTTCATTSFDRSSKHIMSLCILPCTEGDLVAISRIGKTNRG